MFEGARTLDNAKIAAACGVPWDTMSGDHRVRFCQECQLHVYNVSEMTRQEAEDLIQRTEGRLCLRLHRRADGTILTQDCPVGLRMVRRTLAGAFVFTGVLIVSILGLAIVLPSDEAASRSRWDNRLRQVEPFASVLEWLDPTPPPPPFVHGW
jgi:hypothetical protein